MAFRKAHASDPEWAFGAKAEGIGSWIESQWTLWGDGRSLASKTQRLVACLAVLEDRDDARLSPTWGMASLLVELADEVLGSAEFDEVLRGSMRVDEHREILVEALRAYEAALARAGLVDPGRACALLSAQDDLASAGDEACVYGIEPNAAQKRLLTASFGESVAYRRESPSISRVEESVSVRFAFPSGRYAEPLLLADSIGGFACDGRVLATAKRPFDLYRSIAPALSRQGVSCQVHARRLWRQTDFGRAFFAVGSMVEAESFDSRACSDYLLNPFSGISSSRAYAFDVSVRRDRLIQKEECLERLRSLSRSFEFFEELAASVDADALLDYFSDCAYAMQEDESYVAEQLEAVRVLREVMASARMVGAESRTVRCVLEHATVNVSRTNFEMDAADVCICEPFYVETLDEGSWETVVMCDMDNVSFPAKQTDNAALSFARDLGVACERHAMDDMRQAFVEASRRARGRFVIERRLNNESADPTYPAAVVEEFVDCYRLDPTDAAEVDNKYALPPCFLESVIDRGEEKLYENASVSHDAQPLSAKVEKTRLDRIESDLSRSLIMLPREGKGGKVVFDPCFSASQIESYLECPQKWFALRRLRLDELDEGFGAVQMGDFSHNVFEAFYRRFQSEVAPKVTPDSLGRARKIMEDVIVKHAEEQYAMKPSSNRLVPVDAFERRELEELGSKLVSFLDREALLLPSFSPYALEFEIPATNAVEYAGYRVMGKIDRIDVDDRGRAIIIDYKSSLSSDYDLYESQKKGGSLQEGKVQTLVYAQALRRMLGLEVVGALYVGYGRSPKVSGALDRSIEPAEVAGLRAQTCVYRGDFGDEFSSLLDATEERIAVSLDRLMEGRIEARPSSPKACAYCPEISCPKRKG
ncbi:PD-(D/E)XK nuclease family protein [Slackia piriformis]|uniref:PD-(D/E)XK nuclease family protein n=1 Tax=Slackia piriformis TaxID=626934 RepID=UPI0023F40F68|nr:PD-(D/E)XK nuclease family protein [Slackia piriformis]